jgi:hypothetical protein
MFHQLRRVALFTGIAVSAFLVGCAGPAPNYAPSIDNVETLKKIQGSPAVKTGVISVAPGLQGGTSLQLRANTMTSPVGKNYGDYIAEALHQELELAKLYNPQSGVEISGTLLKNNIDAGGVSTNAGQIEARFVVTANGQVRFDKVKRIEKKWDSSFAGAVAIPLAANNYPVMVQSLVTALVTDPDFVKAIRN